VIDDITLRNLSPAGIAVTSRDVTISAVKGIRTTTRVAQLFVELDRKRLTPEQRREVIRKTFTRQEFHSARLSPRNPERLATSSARLVSGSQQD